MFGISLAKILFTVLAVVGIWYAFRWMNRMGQRGAAKARNGIRRTAESRGMPVADLTACPVCGSYVVAGPSAACGKAGCPYGGGK